MKLTLLSRSDLHAALPMRECVESMKRAFAALSAGRAEVPQRLSLDAGGRGRFLVKPAVVGDGFGAKLLSVYPANRERGLPLISGLMALFDPESGRPLALLDGDALTAWRTGAAAGAATDLLALPDAPVAAVLGTGVQARTVARAVDAVREIGELRVYSRSGDNVARFVDEMRPHLRCGIVAAAGAAEAVRGAAIVSAATTANEPVFDGSDLEPGAHVNGIGSFTTAMREIDAETIRRATVFVDSRSAAAAEAGELLQAVSDGIGDAADWHELGDVVSGAAPGRSSDEEVTFFKSVGVAVQDVQAAADAFAAAQAAGLGTEVEL